MSHRYPISTDPRVRATIARLTLEEPRYQGSNGLAQRIRLARTLLGLTQTDLAKACGLTRAAVAFWERPETSNPSARQILVMADLFGVSPDWLLLGQAATIGEDNQTSLEAQA